MANDRVVKIILAGDSAGPVRAFRETEDASAQATRKIEDHSKVQSASFERVRGSVGHLHAGQGLLAGSVGLAMGSVAA